MTIQSILAEFEKGNHQIALESAGQLLANDPNNPQIHHALGHMIQALKGDVDAAPYFLKSAVLSGCSDPFSVVQTCQNLQNASLKLAAHTLFSVRLGFHETGKRELYDWLNAALKNVPYSKNLLPDFMCIGAQKGGTNWVFENLRHHCDVFVPPCQELNFFNSDVYTNLAVYNKAFELSAENQLLGECTPAYALLDDERIRFIAKHIPDLKLIYMLRDPIDRVWSHLKMHVRDLNKTVNDFSSDELVNMISVGDYAWRHSDMAGNLRRWQNHFPSERIFIGNYYDIESRPTGLLTDILSFLGCDIPSSFEGYPYREKFNVSQGGEIDPAIAKVTMTHLPQQYEELNQLLGDQAPDWVLQNK